MKIYSLGLIILSFWFLGACSKQDSLFDTPIQRERGSLRITNSDGFLGAVAVGTTLDLDLLLKSSGGLDLTNISTSLVTSDPITFKGGTFPGEGGTCTAELKSGQSCKLVLTYAPVDLNTHTGSLNFTFDDALGSSSYVFNLSADSHPILTFEYGEEYDFGNKFVGSSTDLKIKISNTGRVNAQNVALNNLTAPFSFKSGNCGGQILVGQSCEITINYAPTNNGQHLQDITLNYLNAGRTETNTLHLLAWGFYEAQLTLTTSGTDNFGTVPNNVNNTKTYTLTHSGGDVAANLITLTGLSSPFSRVGGTCGSTLTIDQGSCTIVIALNSASSGIFSNALTLNYFNGLSTVGITKTLTGESRERPILTFSPSGVNNLGTVKVGQSVTTTYTVTYASGELPATGLNLAGLIAPFSRTGGSCGASLSSGTCDIQITFAPTTYNTWSLPISISYFNTVSTMSSSGLVIAGRSEGRITPQSATLAFGTVVNGQTKDLSIRLDYSGGVAVNNISVQSLTGPYTFTSGSYPGSTSQAARCGTSISSGNCYLYLTFSPTSTGLSPGVLTLLYDNGVDQSTMVLNLTGTGAPAANLAVEDKDYGTTPMNSAVAGPSLVRITNSSSMGATGLTVTLPTGFAYRGGTYPGLSGNCGNSVAASGSCNLDIVFTPLAATTYSGTLSVNYFDGTVNRVATSTLTGIGTTSNDLYISWFNQVSFANIYVGRTPYETKTLTIGHGGGNVSATISSKSFSTNNFNIVSDNCPSSLNFGETCQVVVAFAPQSAGSKNDSLRVDYDSNGVSLNTSRNLAGTGVAPAVITSSVASLDFGQRPVGSPVDLELTLTKIGANTSASSGSLSGSVFSFPGGYPGSGGTCPSSGNFPASCKVVIRFNPSSLSVFNGNFTLNYNNGFQTQQVLVSLTGQGIPTANLVFSSGSYNFGQVIQTTSAERIITLSNSGSAQATGLSFPTLTLPYRFKGNTFPGTGGNCGTSLNVGSSCSVVIEFAPTSVGVSTFNFSVGYNNGFSTTSSSSNLTGEGLAQAIISISEANPYQFGTTNLGASIDKTFTLTNAGSVSGTSLAGSFTSVFSFKNGSFPGSGGTCGTSLNAGSSCTIVLSFTPAAAQSYVGNFTLNYNDGLRTQSEQKELRGTGSAKLWMLGLEDKVKIKRRSFTRLNPYHKGQIFFSRYEWLDINHDGERDEWRMRMSFKRPSVVLETFEGRSEKRIYRFETHLEPDFIHFPELLMAGKDYNRDGVEDLLIGIYFKRDDQLWLRGVDVICPLTGNLIFHYLPLTRQH